MSIIRYIMLYLALGITSCCPTKQVIIPSDTIYVPVTFTDTIQLVRVDSIYGGSTERILLRVDTLWKRAYVRVVDTLRVIQPPDTVQSPVVEKDPTLWNSKQYWLPALAIGLILAFVGLIYFKKF